ncbi:phosphoadenosine phosphosulfate reductase family protein [Novosphingobium sp.]|uniref:phosphoadenosine phosphosulfate reductase domain-containing protein n=1 Tax=Novosphingobium sp. TaxID=1874826 RepID=UPI0031DDB1E9
MAKGINPFVHGSAKHTDMMKTEGLKQALDKYGFDAAFGGARRDEEKIARQGADLLVPRPLRTAGIRRTSARSCGTSTTARSRSRRRESIRVFPLSNWTELDIWQYIYLEDIPIVPLYFAAPRPVVERDGMLMMVDDDRIDLQPGEVISQRMVRFRTLGCYPLTGAVESQRQHAAGDHPGNAADHHQRTPGAGHRP